MSDQKVIRPEFDWRGELAAVLPELRAFARSLASNADLADDIVQEAIMKAWAARDRFEPGTNLKAWLFTILRNTFYSNRRRHGREVQDEDDIILGNILSPSGQTSQMELQELRRALTMLPDEQREALILIGAGGFSHEEAAEIMGVKIGTIKSRVSRAREALQGILDSGAPLPSSESISGSALTAVEELMIDVETVSSAT